MKEFQYQNISLKHLSSGYHLTWLNIVLSFQTIFLILRLLGDVQLRITTDDRATIVTEENTQPLSIVWHHILNIRAKRKYGDYFSENNSKDLDKDNLMLSDLRCIPHAMHLKSTKNAPIVTCILGRNPRTFVKDEHRNQQSVQVCNPKFGIVILVFSTEIACLCY